MRILIVWLLILPFFAAVICHGGQNIPAHLEAENALLYSITSGKNWRLFSDRIDAAMDALVWQDGLSDSQRRELMSRVTWYRWIRDLTGLEAAAGAGCSSTELPGGVIHNRLFLALDPAAPGLLNEFFAAENRIDPVEMIRNLPGGTVFAAAWDVRPAALLEALAGSGSLRDRIVDSFPDGFPMQEVFQSVAGVWSFVVLQDGTGRMQIPDAEGRLFEVLRETFAKEDAGDGKADENRVVLSWGVNILRGDRSLMVYLTAECVEKFSAAGKIEITAEQEAALAKLPEKCFAVAVLLADKDHFTAGGLPLFTGEIPEIVTLTGKSDGKLLIYNGSNTLAGCDLFVSELILSLLEDLSEEPEDDSEEDGEADEDGEAEESEDDGEKEFREKNLEKGVTSSRRDEAPGSKTSDSGDQEGKSGNMEKLPDPPHNTNAPGEKNNEPQEKVKPMSGGSDREEPDGKTGCPDIRGEEDLPERAGEKNNEPQEKVKQMSGGSERENPEVKSGKPGAQKTAILPEVGCDCENILPAARAALAQKPDLAPGFYVLRDGQLISAGDTGDRIAYFGKIESEIPVPQFIAMPHEQRSFCVIFSDGEIRRMRLEKADSFRRITGFIHTVKMYDEKVFRALMEKAAEFDAK